KKAKRYKAESLSVEHPELSAILMQGGYSRISRVRTAADPPVRLRHIVTCTFFGMRRTIATVGDQVPPKVATRIPQNLNYLWPLMPCIPDPLEIAPCTGEGTPTANIPPSSPAQKRRFGAHPYSNL
ncbi:uncharacterized protein LACBIDRAFT_328651, partial [Laccaria bicolor S238N-H82]